MENWHIQLLQLLLSLSILVLIHEFGHYIFARIFKVRVEKFYLFFDPWFSLFKFKQKNSNTEFGIGWIPLGGYCKISGMIDESMDKEQMKQPIKSWEFRSKPAWQRLIIMSAGVILNFIFALLIYSMILFYYGEEYISTKDAKLGMTFNETAKSIGFQDGDVILSVDNKPFTHFDLRRIVNAQLVNVLRNGTEKSIFIPNDLMKRLMNDSLRFAQYIPPLIVDSIVNGSPASLAGFMQGDSITELNGKSFSLIDYQNLLKEIHNQFKSNKKGNTDLSILSFSFYRTGQNKTVDLKITNDTEPIIGIVENKNLLEILPVVYMKYNFLESLTAGFSLGIKTLSNYATDLRYIFSKEGIKNIGGFGTIGSIFSVTWDWHQFWYMTAFLSIILAFMNILPIPALDGGHALFTLYEIISRRKPNEKLLEYAQISGMLLLLVLLIYANGNDLYKWLIK